MQLYFELFDRSFQFKSPFECSYLTVSCLHFGSAFTDYALCADKAGTIFDERWFPLDFLLCALSCSKRADFHEQSAESNILTHNNLHFNVASMKKSFTT